MLDRVTLPKTQAEYWALIYWDHQKWDGAGPDDTWFDRYTTQDTRLPGKW